MKRLFLRNIKKGYATNSSSYHSTLIMTGEEYQKWKQGEYTCDDITFAQMENYDYYQKEGLYFYIEVEEEREINGQKIHAVTYCETSEY